MVQLKNYNIQLKGKYEETSRELSHLHQKYEEISQRLFTAEAELKESRQLASSALVEVKTKEAEKKLSDQLCAETKSQLAMLVQENDRLKADLASVKAEAEGLKTAFDSHKARFAKLSESYGIGFCYLHPRFLSFCFFYRLAAVGNGLRDLGQAHNSSREQLQLVRMEFEDTKRHATSGLKGITDYLFVPF